MKAEPPKTENRGARIPPFLPGATLLFWGWQTGFLAVGAIMAVLLEGARWIQTRWDLADEEFNRIWNFCTLLILAAVIFAFGTNTGPGGLGGMFSGPAMAVGTKVGLSSERTAMALLRWLPMLLFPLVVAQAFSTVGSVPLTAVSIILRWRQRLDRKAGRPARPGPRMDVFYPYFIVCLFAASIRANRGDATYFWGQCALLAWALWPLRSRRFRGAVWSALLLLAIGIGYLGQSRLVLLEQRMSGYSAQLLVRVLRPRTDPSQRATALGQIGRLKLSGRIVVRVIPDSNAPPPTYLREASYQDFRGGNTWFAGGARNSFETINAARTNENTWTLLPGKTNVAVVNIACYLTGTASGSRNPAGLLPLPAGSGRLENLNAYLLYANKTGAVLAEGPGLVIFDAFYGPGATIDSPPTNQDYTVPTDEMPALDQVIADMKLPVQDQARTLQAVQGFFQGQFTYTTWLGPEKRPGTNTTPLGQFLLHSRTGHCEYFATATVLLLRELGIPARYAVGYAVHEPARKGYVVRDRDAHAWCLVWNPAAKAWENFDTTPASWIAAESKRATFGQRLSDFWSAVGFQIAKFRWGRTEWRQYFLWALVPVLTLLLYQILFRRGRKRHRRRHAADTADRLSWPGLDSEFYQLERQLADRGVPRLASEPLSDWLTRALVDPALNDLQTPLRELLQLHYRYRFDPRGLDANERQSLEREARACLDRLARLKSGAGPIRK